MIGDRLRLSYKVFALSLPFSADSSSNIDKARLLFDHLCVFLCEWIHLLAGLHHLAVNFTNKTLDSLTSLFQSCLDNHNISSADLSLTPHSLHQIPTSYSNPHHTLSSLLDESLLLGVLRFVSNMNQTIILLLLCCRLYLLSRRTSPQEKSSH